MRAPRLIAFLALTGTGGGCTGLGYVDRYVPSQIQGSERGFERVEPAPHVVGGAGWRLGGTPLAVRLQTSQGCFRIQCHEFGWDAYTVGPILPVIPNIWGSGHCFPQIEVQVLLEPGS